ncbi:MAG: CPBP family intramembrane metalloprotease [Bdellovibrionales bacterium]|nr:CPBP family intramembrane metalloprotease [Bdellovibrionales bacterium]
MSVPFLASLYYFVLATERSSAQFAYGTAKLFILLWPLVAIHFIDRRHLSHLTLRVLLRKQAVIEGVIVGVILGGGLLLLLATPLAGILDARGEAIQRKADALGIREHYILFAILLSVFHSFLEEYYWRWFVYGILRLATSRVTASLVAAAGFSAHHFVVAIQFFGWSFGVICGFVVFAAGLLWNAMYERQGTLGGAWVSHILVDAALLAIGYSIVVP